MKSNSRPKAYGDPLAGGSIDMASFFKKPLVISRIISMLISIIVFSTIISGGWFNNICIINGVPSNCNFITAVGIIALMFSVTFLSVDIIMPHISSLELRKKIVILDIVFSCCLTILWLVSTGVIIGEWWKTSTSTVAKVQNWQFMCIQTAAAFCIFALAIWILMTALGARRFHSGKSELFLNTNEVNRVENRNFDSVYPGAAGGNESNAQVQKSSIPPVVISGKRSSEYAKPTVKY